MSDFNYAFPTGDQSGYTAQGGLTKREMLAAMAMQGVMSRFDCAGPMETAEISVEYADALINKLKLKQLPTK